jgi:hypothetical protein
MMQLQLTLSFLFAAAAIFLLTTQYERRTTQMQFAKIPDLTKIDQRIQELQSQAAIANLLPGNEGRYTVDAQGIVYDRGRRLNGGKIRRKTRRRTRKSKKSKKSKKSRRHRK